MPYRDLVEWYLDTPELTFQLTLRNIWSFKRMTNHASASWKCVAPYSLTRVLKWTDQAFRCFAMWSLQSSSRPGGVHFKFRGFREPLSCHWTNWWCWNIFFFHSSHCYNFFSTCVAHTFFISFYLLLTWLFLSGDIIELYIYHQPGVKPSLTLCPFGVLGYVAGHSLTVSRTCVLISFFISISNMHLTLSFHTCIFLACYTWLPCFEHEEY